MEAEDGPLGCAIYSHSTAPPQEPRKSATMPRSTPRTSPCKQVNAAASKVHEPHSSSLSCIILWFF
jgi:hypothetical protein